MPKPSRHSLVSPAARPSPAGNQPTPSAATISPARLAAAEILEEIGATGAHSDDLLHGPRLRPLSQVDRDLATALVLGVLRWGIALDARLRPLLSRPDLKLAPSIQIVLRLGAFQLLHLERIPAHAAINESVELARFAGQPHAAGMVNAVLRKLGTAPELRRPLVESIPAMAERLGHPAWLAERWANFYGRAAAEAICTFDQQPPANVVGEGVGTATDLFAPFGENGTVPAMDAGSRLVAELAAASCPAAERVWDCCAAPGGKTIVLAARLPSTVLLATDNSPARLKRLRERLTRDMPGSQIEITQIDAAAAPESLGTFNLILCDVPCSGTGTLARNPEIRHRLVLADLRRQAERGERILRGAAARLAPGGRLLYSTCSLEPEENEAVVDAVLSTSPGLRRLPLQPVLQDMHTSGRLRLAEGELERLGKSGFLRTLPGYPFKGDGFFAALLEAV